MRYRSTLLTAFLFLAIIGNALGQGKSFTLGLKGGVNLSRLSMGEFLTTRYDPNGNPYLGYDGGVVRDNLRQSFETKTGWSAGVYARLGNKLFFQPELMVSTKSAVIDIVPSDNAAVNEEDVEFKFSTIDVPLLVGFKGGPFRFAAGPIGSFRIAEDQKLSEAFQYYTTGNNAVNEVILGYQLGLGVDFGAFSLDVRREGSFEGISSLQIREPQGQDVTSIEPKLRSWQVTLGIRIL